MVNLLLGIIISAVVCTAVAIVIIRRYSAANNQLGQDNIRLQIELKQTESRLAAQQEADEQFRIELAEREQREREQQKERDLAQLNLMREQFENSSQRLLSQRQEELRQQNKQSMDQIISPLKEQLTNINTLLGQTRSSNDKNSANLEGVIKTLMEQQNKLTEQTSNLTTALTTRGKVHGDWGEHVLNDILQGSGLREGEEFFVQPSYKGAHNNDLRPDVVVNSADGSKIIIDSKVSLTDYTNYIGAATEQEREQAKIGNYNSMRKHVKELADKNYPHYVNGSINYVLMFVPNEGAYVLAMNHKPELAMEAFNQGIIILNPTNLMLALHLILQTWHNSRQDDNSRRIVEAAGKMYDKFVGFVDTFQSIGSQLQTANKSYDKALGQLYNGKGNLMNQMSSLSECGVSTTKRPKKQAFVIDTPIEEAE